jgi:hypothetical protein
VKGFTSIKEASHYRECGLLCIYTSHLLPSRNCTITRGKIQKLRLTTGYVYFSTYGRLERCIQHFIEET